MEMIPSKLGRIQFLGTGYWILNLVVCCILEFMSYLDMVDGIFCAKKLPSRAPMYMIIIFLRATRLKPYFLTSRRLPRSLPENLSS